MFSEQGANLIKSLNAKHLSVCGCSSCLIWKTSECFLVRLTKGLQQSDCMGNVLEVVVLVGRIGCVVVLN